jgi:hypothetical protein
MRLILLRTVHATPISMAIAFDGTWTDHMEGATAGSKAATDINLGADDAYLVKS